MNNTINETLVNLRYESELIALYENTCVKFIINPESYNQHTGDDSESYRLNFNGYNKKIGVELFEDGMLIKYVTGKKIGFDIPLKKHSTYEAAIVLDNYTSEFSLAAQVMLSDHYYNSDWSVSDSFLPTEVEAHTMNLNYGSQSVVAFENVRPRYTFSPKDFEIHGGLSPKPYRITFEADGPEMTLHLFEDNNLVSITTDVSITINRLLNKNSNYCAEIYLPDYTECTVISAQVVMSDDIADGTWESNINQPVVDVETNDTVDDKTDDTLVADPVDSFTGAHLLNNDLMVLFGGKGLRLTASYNSMHPGNNSLGIGWYHNYEKKVVANEDSYYVYEKPSLYNVYSPVVLERDDEGNALTYSTDTYTCEDIGKFGYELTKTTDGFTLVCADERIEYYNTDGKLCKITDHHGFDTIITYSDLLTTVTDTVCGKSIYMDHDSTGKIVSVRDDCDRRTTLTYFGDCLVNICDVNGKNLSYCYAYNNRLKFGNDDFGTRYFYNDYDEFGRVVSQTDGENNPSTTFVYDGNTRTVTNRNGDISTRVFNDNGQLVSITDENGSIKTYEYDTKGNIVKETDALGNVLTSTYNTNNNLSGKRDKNGNLTKYVYDSKSNITKITHPNGSIEKYYYNSRNQPKKYEDARGTITLFTYDENGMPASKKVGDKPAETFVYENGLLKSKTDAMGNTTSYSYNDLGQCISVTDALNNTTSYEYDLIGNLLKVTYPDESTVSYTYDCNNQKTSFTDENGNVTTYSYTGNLKLKSVTYPNGSTEEHSYDSEDRIIRTKTRADLFTERSYDAVGRLTAYVDEAENEKSYYYDEVGNLVEEHTSITTLPNKEYDAMGNVIKVTDYEGNVTRYYYDNMSRLIRSVNAVGGMTLYEYSSAGDLVSKTDAVGNKTVIIYDAYGNKASVTDPNGNVTSFAYDHNNNLISKTDALGNTTTYEYDALNRLVKTTDANNHSITYGYDLRGRRTTVTDAKGNVTTTSYDDCGNILTVTDAKGNVITTNTYNSLNLLASATNAASGTVSYTYTDDGRISTVTDALGGVKTYEYEIHSDSKSIGLTDTLDGYNCAQYNVEDKLIELSGPFATTANYSYDDMGRVLDENSDPHGYKEYEYNELNLKKKQYNAALTEHKFYYDANGKITGFITPEEAIGYSYDGNYNVIAVSDGSGTTLREYDALGRVVKMTDTYGYVVGYRYDAVGNLAAIVYPDNTEVTYTYDENNNLLTVTDWKNKVTSYEYDENNLVTKITRPNSTSVQMTYDNAHRLISSVDMCDTGAVICSYQYTYNAKGKLATEKDLVNNIEICYTYDSEGRIIKRVDKDLSEGTQSEENFAYDLAGNILEENNEYYANTLVKYNGFDIDYDVHGNSLCGYIKDGKTDFEYDSQNRLVRAGNVQYVYNAENTRIGKIAGIVVTEYVHDTTSRLSRLLMQKKHATSSVITKFVYGLGLISQYESTTAKYYHFDYRGSTVAISSSSGGVSAGYKYAYDTYGDLTKNKTNSSTNSINFLYNGRDGVIDDHNGLYYMRSRYYSPKVKRFLTLDSELGDISETASLNRYAFANCDPVNFIDPTGHSAERGIYGYGTIYYNGEPYSIYVPNHLQTSIDSVWETIDTKYDTNIEFDGTKLFQSLIENGLENAKMGYWNLLKIAADGITASLSSSFIEYKLQKSGDKKRVIISLGNSDTKKIYNAFINNTVNFVSCYKDPKTVSQSTKELFQELTDSHHINWDFEFDIRVLVDESHKNSQYHSYLSIDENGKLIQNPIVYEKDRVIIGRWEGLNFIEMYNVPIDMPTALS